MMKVLDTMDRLGYNTLVIHRNDVIERLVYPGALFGADPDKEYASMFERYADIYEKLYRFTPTRRSGPIQRRAYFKRLLEEAGRRNIQVYVENKELYFPSIILEMHPEVVNGGPVCPTAPYWIEFIKMKYKEFFEEYPEVAGVITSVATGESMASFSSNRCKCERCQNTKPVDWYRSILTAIDEPIRAAGKQLVVRDFVFDRKTHGDITSAMSELPKDIIISLKNTPHDYYPTYPDNPRIGTLEGFRTWIEFDTMGQYFGWGVGMAAMAEDYRRRMKHALNCGATGVIARTDWESLDGHCSFDNMNSVNLYAFAAVAQSNDACVTDIYRRWLEDRNALDMAAPETVREKAIGEVRDLMEQTWSVCSHTPYVHDVVFSDSSQLPVGYHHALWLSEIKNSLRDWDPTKNDALYADRWENIADILREKDEALAAIQRLCTEAQQLGTGLTADFCAELRSAFAANVLYVEGFRIAAYGVFLTRYFKDNTQRNPEEEALARKLLNETLEGFDRQIAKFQAYFKEPSDWFINYTLLDFNRLISLKKDLLVQLADTDFSTCII